ELAGVFRASGRMLWPVYYVLVLLALVLVVRAYDRRTALVLIAIALVVQIVDGAPGRAAVRSVWTQPVASAWDTPLRDPFWQAAAQRYTALRWVPPRNAGPHWKVLADYAGRHGMA